MSGRIAPHSLENIKTNLSIAEVVRAFTSLKPAGKGLLGLCPFHQEKTPSLNVNEHEGLFYCFGCQAGGDAITFVQKMLNLEFTEAVEWIADRMNLHVEYVETNQASHDAFDALKRLMESACQWFESQLSSQEGIRKILRDRGVDDKLAQTFRLGFSPESWDALRKDLEKKGFTQDQGVDSGLLSPSTKGLPYARFRNRITIPVFDRKGNVIAFGGRLCGSDPQAPKYINSPETPLFRKGETFFGGPFWEQTALQKRQVVIVEGYFDVIGLWNRGLRQAVAVMGLGLTEKHLQWLKQKELDVVLMLDGDEAGERASARLLPLFLKQDVYAREVILPAGEDPDTFAQKMTEAQLYDLIEKAPLQIDAAINRILKKFQGTIESEIEGTRLALEVLNNIGDPTAREIRLKHLAQRLGVSLQHLRGTTSKLAAKEVNITASSLPASIRTKALKMQPVQSSGSGNTGINSAEEMLLELVVVAPRRLENPQIVDVEKWCRMGRVSRALAELRDLWMTQGFSVADKPVQEREDQFLKYLRDLWSEHPEKLHWLAATRAKAAKREQPVLSQDQGSEQSDAVLLDCLKKIKDVALAVQGREALYSMKQLDPSKDWDQLRETMEKQQERAKQRLHLREVN